MKRQFRLTRSSDYRRVRHYGKAYAYPLMVLIVGQNPFETTRIGIVASHAVGNAVQRNRAKRRIRACMDTFYPCIESGYDLVILSRKPVLTAGYLDLCNAMETLLARASLLDAKESGNGKRRSGL